MPLFVPKIRKKPPSVKDGDTINEKIMDHDPFPNLIREQAALFTSNNARRPTIRE